MWQMLILGLCAKSDPDVASIVSSYGAHMYMH